MKPIAYDMLVIISKVVAPVLNLTIDIIETDKYAFKMKRELRMMINEVSVCI